ncbi:MAG: GvpL/GvpF family gas vesicle protein [Planctomycetota bacterium]|nr:GvpL/GvpF family gas vesicle protein [Planctomycetota bacterium]
MLMGVCIVREADLRALGSELTDLAPIVEGVLCMLAATVEQPWPADAARVSMYQKLVNAVAARATCVPLRFGEIFADEAAVGRALRLREGPILQAIERVRGRVEWMVTLPAPTRAPAQVELKPLTGRAFLESRRAALGALPEPLPEQLRGLEAISSQWAWVDPATSAPGAPGHRRVCFLVPREFTAQVRELVAALSDDVRVTGPWAPAVFAAIRDE